MCRQPKTPMDYKHQQLMDEINEFMIAVKIYMHPDKFGEAIEELKKVRPPIEIKDIDHLQRRINEILRQDARPFIKY